MSGLVRWPDNLPLPLLNGYGYTPGNNLEESKMEGGYSRLRKTSKSVPSTMQVKFLFTAGEAALFEGWYYHEINDGQDWFLMDVKVAAGLIEHEVRFKPPPKKITALSANLWRKDAILIIKKREIITPELTDLLQQHKLRGLEKAAKISDEIEL